MGFRADIGDEAGVASLQVEPHLVKGEVHGPSLPTLSATDLGTAYKFGSNSGGGKLVLWSLWSHYMIDIKNKNDIIRSSDRGYFWA